MGLAGKLKDIKKVEQMSNLGEAIDELDDFKFKCASFCYTWYDKNKELMDPEDFAEEYPEEITADEVSELKVTDRVAPEYVVRFEDDIPESYMVKFVKHVISNLQRDSRKGYRAYLMDNSQVSSLDGDEDNDGSFMSELQTETVSSDADNGTKKMELAYSMYRMQQLSTKTGVNMLSLIFAYMKNEHILRSSSIPDKPSVLVDNGPVYYADSNGDCTVRITAPNDKALKKARDLLVTGGQFREYEKDYIKLKAAIRELGIAVSAEDPTRYNHIFIKSISNSILVNNYDYVARGRGGYNKGVLRQLKSLTLDLVVKDSMEEEFDPLEKTLSAVLDNPGTPNSILKALNKTPKDEAVDVAYKLFELKQSNEFDELSLPVSSNVSRDGFILDAQGDYYIMNGSRVVKDLGMTHIATGRMYFHFSGYVLFETVVDKVLIVTLDNLIAATEGENFRNMPIVIPGGLE